MKKQLKEKSKFEKPSCKKSQTLKKPKEQRDFNYYYFILFFAFEELPALNPQV